jgi:hypothetical protein
MLNVEVGLRQIEAVAAAAEDNIVKAENEDEDKVQNVKVPSSNKLCH